MHALAAVVAAGLLGAVALPGGSGDARVDAATAIYEVSSGTYRLEGGVVITRGLVRLRAGAARYDPRTGTVDATGGVLLTDASRAIAAEGIHAVLDGDFEARGVVAFLKDGPVDLGGAATAAEAGACGRNALIAHAEAVGGGRSGTLRLEGARVTPCDCAGGAPSWELRAATAVVHPGERVVLTWPVLYVTPRFLFIERPVPIFTFPWVSLPLGERVSGLLAPELGGATGVTGLSLAQPYYQTLGPTADLTVTPRWYFGRSRAEVAGGEASVRGPSGSLEGRWTPVVGAAGRLQADVTWDEDDQVGPLDGADGARGLRLALQGDWAQRLGARTSLRLDLDLVGDPLYVRDFTPDVLLRDAAARRSAALVSWRGEPAVVELSTAWLEPVSRTGALAQDVDYGLFGGKLPAFHRWPSLAATLLPARLAGPLRLSGRVGLSRFGPPNGVTSDGGGDGVGPGDRGWVRDAGDPGELDGRWGPGERLAASRLDVRAELSAPFTIGDALALEPSLRGAAAGYAFDAAVGPLAAGWASAGLTVTTGLLRRFGELRHELAPRLEWRATTGAAGGALPAFGYDGWDRGAPVPAGVGASFGVARLAAAAPPGLASQLRLSLATRLARGDEELARAELGQELDLRRGRLAEAFLRASAVRGPLSGEVDARLWTAGRLVPVPEPAHASWLDAFSEIRLKLALADGRGDELRAGLLAVGSGGSGRLGGGVDDLFDPRPAGTDALAAGSLAALIRLGPATVGYEVLLAARTSVVPGCDGVGSRVADAWEVQQQTGSVEWNSPCRCFRARVAVRLNACGELVPVISLDLGRAGAVVGR
jgi:LPS-assembly protein